MLAKGCLQTILAFSGRTQGRGDQGSLEKDACKDNIVFTFSDKQLNYLPLLFELHLFMIEFDVACLL